MYYLRGKEYLAKLTSDIERWKPVTAAAYKAAEVWQGSGLPDVLNAVTDNSIKDGELILGPLEFVFLDGGGFGTKCSFDPKNEPYPWTADLDTSVPESRRAPSRTIEQALQAAHPNSFPESYTFSYIGQHVIHSRKQKDFGTPHFSEFGVVEVRLMSKEVGVLGNKWIGKYNLADVSDIWLVVNKQALESTGNLR